MRKTIILLKHFLTKYQLPILSGFFIGTSYIPFPPWATLFGFVPLWIFVLKQKRMKEVLIGGWLTQFTLTLIGFNWVAHTIHEFGFMPWSVSILGLLIFCSFANLYIPIALVTTFLLAKKLNLNFNKHLLLLAGVTALFEPIILTIFEWNFGYTWFWANFPIYQLAEFIGFQGLSTLVIFINAAMTYFWCNRSSQKGIVSFASAVLFFCLLNLLGFVIEKSIAKPDGIVRPLIVQANISNQQKVYAEKGYGFRTYIVDKFLTLTLSGLKESQPKPDFALWPETAFPEYLNDDFAFQQEAKKVKRFLFDNQLPLVTGAYSKDIKTQQSGNSIFFLDHKGQEITPRYNKIHLLAFGEYLPGGELFPPLKKLFPMVADFSRGKAPQVNSIANINIGSQICYESLSPFFTKQLADLGAEAIINVTNDSWFGLYQEPYQHLYMTLARAIEVRRPILRSTNTGISTVVLASGKVLTQSPLHKEWAHAYTVPYVKNPAPTFYQKFFWLIPGLLSTFILFLIGHSFLKRIKF